MATKIITWISSRKADITRSDNGFSFAVKPFNLDYKGANKEIRYIRFTDNEANIKGYQDLAPDITQDSKWLHGRIALELAGKNFEVRNNDVLVITDKIPAGTWNWSSDFRFTLTEMENWDGGVVGGDLNRSLILHIREKTIEPQCFSPLIKQIIVDCGKWDNGVERRNNLKSSLEIGREHSLNMTADNTTRARMITENRLDLNSLYGSIPTFSKIDTNDQPINQDAVEEQKVREVYSQAKTAFQNRRTNLEVAIQALKELLKIGKEGTETEKRKFVEITTKYELDSMKKELVHNCYEQRKNLPNWEGEADTPPPPKQEDETPTLWEQENAQPGFVERYNELFKGEKHSSLVKYNQLHSQIHDNFEQYKDKPLFKQIDEKESSFKDFRSVWDTDNQAKRLEIKNFNDTELAKREEAVKLMEQLLAENKADSSSNSKKRKNDEQSNEPNKKPKTLSEIKSQAQHEVKKRDKITENTLTGLIQEAQGKNTYAELEPLLKAIDEHKGEKAYVDKENEITELKRRLVKLDSKSYKTSVSFELNDKLEKYGIANSDLDSESQSLIRKLEDETISEEEIIQVEKKVNEFIEVKNALNKLERLVQELETARKQKNKKKGEDKLQELISFVESSSSYQQKAYSQKKETVDNLIKGSENSKSSLDNKGNDFSWVPIVAVGTVMIVGIIGVVVYRSWKKKVKKNN